MGLESSNVNALLEAMDKDAEEKPQEEEKPEEKPEENGKDSERKIVLHKIDIRGVSASVTSSFQIDNGVPDIKVPLPPITIEDFQKEFGSLKPAEIGQVLVKKILNSAIEATKDV